MLVHNDWGDGGILKGCKVELVGRRLENLEVSPDTSVAEQELQPCQHRSSLVHYTLEFELPPAYFQSSSPWRFHLEAKANSFLTLNGHLLGRYWSEGPQRDIWLPECWLNFGTDAKNVIELQARPTASVPVGEVIRRAEVLPYVQSTKHEFDK